MLKNIKKHQNMLRNVKRIKNLEIFVSDRPTDRPTDQGVESRARD